MAAGRTSMHDRYGVTTVGDLLYRRQREFKHRQGFFLLAAFHHKVMRQRRTYTYQNK